MNPEDIREKMRQHRASLAKRRLEIPELGLVGDDAAYVPPVTVDVRSKFLEKFMTNKYAGMIFILSKLVQDKDGKPLFSEPFLRNEGDPQLIETMFAFVNAPFSGGDAEGED